MSILPHGPGHFEVLQRHALVVLVASVAENDGGVLVCNDRLCRPPYLQQGVGEVAQRYAFAVPFSGVLEDGDGALESSNRFLEPLHGPESSASRRCLASFAALSSS